MAEKRIFISIPMPSEVIKEVARIQEQLKKKLQFIGKTTELENLHLTLKFLGEINDDALKKVKEELLKIKFKPLKLKLGHVGAFSYKNMPRIVWIKILGDASKIQKQVDESLQEIFPKEERFMSHLTIARIKYVKDIKYAKEYLKHLNLPQISWTENKIQLKESTLKPQGPAYTTLEEYSAQKDS
ncbi:MAG: RNA 2',3'-cyclic phosphodiesterase [Nanoarchaeota archaeon]